MGVVGIGIDRKRSGSQLVCTLGVALAIDALLHGDPRGKSFRQDTQCPNVMRVDRQRLFAESEAGLRFVAVYAVGKEDRFTAQREIFGVETCWAGAGNA